MSSIDIVIPTLNEEKYLPNLLEDIKLQSVQPKNIIVADANSTDKTRSIAKQMGAQVVNGGTPAVARNSGAKHAQADYILFIDADVRLKDKEFIAKSIADFNKKKLDVANFTFGNVGDLKVNWIYFLWNILQRFSIALKKPYATGGGILITDELFRKVGGFEESLPVNEDAEFITRLHKSGYKFNVLSSKIYPSSRRYQKVGVISVLLLYFVSTILTINGLRHLHKRFYPYLINKAGKWGDWEK